jgi:hypothetical protein
MPTDRRSKLQIRTPARGWLRQGAFAYTSVAVLRDAS